MSCLKEPLKFLLLGFFLFSFSFPLSASPYTYDQKYSKVVFTLKQLGLVMTAGHFKTFSGAFTFDPEKIEDSEVSLRIETASLKAKNALQDIMLRSQNFFWPEKYPEILFKSKQFTNIKGKEFEIHGDLTVRGVTRPVIFKTKLLTSPEKILENTSIRFHTETFINRKDFKLGTGNVLDPMIGLTKETLKISLEVVGIPEKE